MKAHLTSGRPCGRKWPANEVPFTIPNDLQSAPDDWELNVCLPEAEILEGPHKFYIGRFCAVPPSPNMHLPQYSKACTSQGGDEVENSFSGAWTQEVAPLPLVDSRDALVLPGIEADSDFGITLPSTDVVTVSSEDARVPLLSPDNDVDCEPVEDSMARGGTLIPGTDNS
ncbi:hypothetical protein M758_UG233700 [Ceratodon purpureus]|nr:hypothetical protein M758_UG233700 [Ceratodon purpureus]